MVLFILFLTGAYVLGSIPAAQIVARRHGIDLRRVGTGNVGASNLVEATSKRTAIPVFLADFGKGLIVVLAAKWVGLDAYAQVAVGLAAVAGHNWSIFLRFEGGRGILTAYGMVLGLVPWLAVIMVGVALAFRLFRATALGVLLLLLCLPLAVLWLGPPLGDTNKSAYFAGFAALLLITIIRRLTAHGPPDAAPVSPRERFINRLLFDRDIRDRRAWTSTSRSNAPQARSGD